MPIRDGFVGSSSFWLLLGALALLTSAAALIRRLRFVAGAHPVGATVVGRTPGRPARMIVRTDEGDEAVVVGRGRARSVGSTLEVLVNPDQPGHALRPGRWEAGGLFVAGMLLSVVLFGVGLMTR